MVRQALHVIKKKLEMLAGEVHRVNAEHEAQTAGQDGGSQWGGGGAMAQNPLAASET